MEYKFSMTHGLYNIVQSMTHGSHVFWSHCTTSYGPWVMGILSRRMTHDPWKNCSPEVCCITHDTGSILSLYILYNVVQSVAHGLPVHHAPWAIQHCTTVVWPW